KSEPLRPDTDGDNVIDSVENSAGTDPRNPNDKPGPPFTPAFRDSLILSAAGVRMAPGPLETVLVLTANSRLNAYYVDPTTFAFAFRDSLTITGSPVDIAVDGPRAFIAAGATGLHVVDISNIIDIKLVTTITGLGTVSGVAAGGGLI